jgi:RNA polymerase sigma factor (sigma-70 family)
VPPPGVARNAQPKAKRTVDRGTTVSPTTIRWDLFRLGDSAAFGTVYEAFGPAVERRVRYHLRSCCMSPCDADVADLVHEVFDRAFGETARSRADPARGYDRYLGTIARNSVIDWLRCRSREVPRSPEQVAALLERSSMATDAVEVDTAELVGRYVDDLPQLLKSLYHLRYGLGQSQESVAESLHVSRQRVRTLELRLRRGLGQWLAGP